MKGLLKRAVIKRTSNNNKPNINSRDPGKDEIYTEIDRIIKKLHEEASSASTDFSVIKNDTVIPLIVIIGSIVVLIAGGLFFLSFYNSKEKTILTTRNRVLSTESKILAAVKAESEEQLEIKDQQIKSIQNQLSTAIEDKNRLKEDTEITLNAREEELKNAMNETLEAERAKLIEQGLSSEDIQKKIAETSNRLEAENQSVMNDFKEKYEQELAEKELAMSIKIEEYQYNLDQSKSEQARLEEQIAQREKELRRDFDDQSAALESQRNLVLSQLEEIDNISTKEHLASSQILESYRSIEIKISESEYEDALAEIENLENFLKQDSVLELPGIKERLPVENFVINTLKNSINMEMTIENVFPQEKASLNTDIDILEGKLSAAANNIKSKEEQIQQADKEREELNSILQKMGDIKKNINDQEQILDLLGTKILLKQVLSSEPIKSQHPDLLDQIELYFDVLGDTQKEAGRKAVLTEISNLMESLQSTE